MLSLLELTVRCHSIGMELCGRQLSHYELIDRATALTFLGRSLQGLMGAVDLAPGSTGAEERAQQEIDAALIMLRAIAVDMRSGSYWEGHDTLIEAQTRLSAACRLLRSTFPPVDGTEPQCKGA